MSAATRRNLGGALALWLCTSAALAEPARLELGVCTHFGLGKTAEQPLFAWAQKSGISSLRDEVLWSDVELEPGKYVLRGRALHTVEALRRAHALGLRPLVILGYGNPLYDGGGQPSSAEGRRAFAAYAAWLAQTLGSDATYFEVWNEWNLGAGTRPRVSSGSPEAYVLLLAEASAAIKAVRPEATVLGGGMGGDAEGWPWLRAAIEAGLLRHADGVSVHLYNHAGPRAGGGVSEFVARLHALVALLDQAGATHMPIHVTETGWPSHEGPGRIETAEAARRALRLLLELRRMPRVAGLWLYEFSDGGADAHEAEHHFGLLDAAQREKPIACRVRSLAKWLPTAQRVRSFEVGDVRVEQLRTRGARDVLALWLDETGNCTSKEVVLRGQALSAQHFGESCGEPRRAVLGHEPGELHITVSGAPQLFWLKAGARIDTVSASEGLVSQLAGALCKVPPLRTVLGQ